MKFKTILSSLILAIAVIIAQKLNYMVEAKVSTTYNATYQFVWCSIIMLVLGIVVGLNVIWILEASSYIDTIVAIVLQIVAAGCWLRSISNYNIFAIYDNKRL